MKIKISILTERFFLARPHKDFGFWRTLSTSKAEIRGERCTPKKYPLMHRNLCNLLGTPGS